MSKITRILLIFCGLVIISNISYCKYIYNLKIDAFSLKLEKSQISNYETQITDQKDDSFKNIDNISPQILGIENGKTYIAPIEIDYKDNDKIKNIIIENKTTLEKYYFELGSNGKMYLKNEVAIYNREINPYKITTKGNYIITVIDYSGNSRSKNIIIK